MSDRDTLHAILDGVPVGVWVARAPTGELVYVNDAFRNILRTTAKDRPIADAASDYGIHHRSTGELYTLEELPFSRALAAGELVVDDDLVLRGSGGEVHVRAFAQPLLDEGGEPWAVVIAFIDIGLEASAVAGRRSAEARLAAAVEHAPIVVWMADASGIITLSEGAGLERLGVRPGELRGRNLLELYGDHAEVVATFRHALAGEALRNRVALPTVVFDSWIAPQRDTQGNVIGVIGVSTDVTERAQLESQLIQSDRVAAMGMLAASIAHEINNPLTSIFNGLRAARSELVAAEQEGQAAAHVRRAASLMDPVFQAAERLQHVTRDLRTFQSRDAEPEPADVGATLESVLALVQKECEARARLRVSLAPCPPVAATSARLGQVFLNLLLNAVQALEDGSPERDEIRVTTRPEADRVVIEIADTGSGIAEEHKARIFEPFYTTKQPGVGTGLGLFVCRDIVRGFGGDISVLDAPGGGAIFRVSLPRATSCPTARGSGAHRPAVSGAARLLIVDDDPGLGKLFKSILAYESYDVTLLSSAKLAVERLSSGERFDLVLCDLMMTGFSGIDLYDALSVSRPDLVDEIVFMTGGAYTARARAFLERIPNQVLEKPFDVVEEVAKLLNQSRR